MSGPRLVGTCPRCVGADVPLERVQTRDVEGRPTEAPWCLPCAAERRQEWARRFGDYPGGAGWW